MKDSMSNKAISWPTPKICIESKSKLGITSYPLQLQGQIFNIIGTSRTQREKKRKRNLGNALVWLSHVTPGPGI